MFRVALIVISQMETTNIPFSKWHLFRPKMSDFDIKQHGINACAYYQLKEASVTNLGTVWFQLCDILETLFLETVKTLSMLSMSWWGRRLGWVYKRSFSIVNRLFDTVRKDRGPLTFVFSQEINSKTELWVIMIYVMVGPSVLTSVPVWRAWR